MALRGRSRKFDDAGACGAQKLVLTGDLKLLEGQPSPRVPWCQAQHRSGEDSKLLTNLEKLLRYLSTAGLSCRVYTETDQ